MHATDQRSRKRGEFPVVGLVDYVGLIASMPDILVQAMERSVEATADTSASGDALVTASRWS
jgi:hypothetical protein